MRKPSTNGISELWKARYNPRIPGFMLVDGRDCDPRWTWHVDPASMEWVDLSTEVCDGRPSDIEGDKRYWIDNVKSYCPWSATVVALDRR